MEGIADTNRLRILNLLTHGELCVCDLQYAARVATADVSRHLTISRTRGSCLTAATARACAIALPIRTRASGANSSLFCKPLLRTRKCSSKIHAD